MDAVVRLGVHDRVYVVRGVVDPSIFSLDELGHKARIDLLLDCQELLIDLWLWLRFIGVPHVSHLDVLLRRNHLM